MNMINGIRPRQVMTKLAKSNTVQKLTGRNIFGVSHVIKRNEGVELAQKYYYDFVQLLLSEALKSLH